MGPVRPAVFSSADLQRIEQKLNNVEREIRQIASQLKHTTESIQLLAENQRFDVDEITNKLGISMLELREFMMSKLVPMIYREF